MQPRRATWTLLASLLVLLLAVFVPPPGGAADTIIAKERLRQGDPLVAWVVTDSPPASPLVARLLDETGRVVASARCYPAAGLVEAGEGSEEGLSPASPPRAEPRSDRGFLGVLMSLPLDVKPGDYRLLAGGASLPVAVDARNFPLETISLGAANSSLRTVPTPRKTAQARSLYALLDTVDDSALYADDSPFMFPVEGGRRSAGFGDTRRYLYHGGGSEMSVHAGIDWAVGPGTVVSACARGRVVMAEDRDVTGKTVVIEHLPGLYSLYFHLSSIEVEEGKLVEKGGRIALSGSTGLATGPHLHWEIRVAGRAVDPEYWLGSPLLDKNRVKAIMYGLIEGR